MKDYTSFSEFKFNIKKSLLNEATFGDAHFHNVYHKGDYKYLKAVAEYIRKNGEIKIGSDGSTAVKATEADAKFLDDLVAKLKTLKNDTEVKQYLNNTYKFDKSFKIKLPSGFNFEDIFKGEFSGHGEVKITTSEETSIKETLCSIAIALGINKDDESSNNRIKEICEGKSIKNICSSDIDSIQKLTKKFGFNLFISRDYVSSAIACSKAFQKFFGKLNINNFNIARQKQDSVTQLLYKTASKFGGDSGDNWNPADIWLISNEFNSSKFNKTIKVIDESPDEGNNKLMAYNRYILQLIDMEIILPVSLKKIEESESGDAGHCELMVSNGLRKVQTFEGLKPLKFKDIVYMKNAKNKDVASGFYLYFTDGNKKEWNFTLWEKSNSGFTTELRDPNNSNNKSGVSKELVKQIVPGFDDLSQIYDNGKFTKLYNDAKKLLISREPDLKGTFEFLENPKNITDINSPLTVSNKAIFTILNSYIMLKNVILADNTDVIFELYLAGLKIRDGFCPHYKIY